MELNKMFAVREVDARVQISSAPLENLSRIKEALPNFIGQESIAPPDFETVRHVIDSLQPSEPVFCINARELRAATRQFSSFPGRILYAVKCNPNPFVLKTLFDAGITDFDVASLNEIRLIDGLFGKVAGQFFNNPVKSRPAIKSASSAFGIRFFTADSIAEIDKILYEIESPRDIVIAVRLSTAGKDARYVLSTKFGAEVNEAVMLLQYIQKSNARAGISFHVGSQCLSPQAFSAALKQVGKVVKKAGVPINVLNVGGGFPAPYPGDKIRGLDYYLSHIIHGWRDLNLPLNCLLFCEPGRSLVATAGTVILQVVNRRDGAIFVNDGVFGTLQELGHPKESRPTLLHRRGGNPSQRMAKFKVYGPTCDSNDVLGAPFTLPEDVREGDWIEVGMMGAYSLSMRTAFNGFHTDKIVAIQ
jgi:ornithine decarboxylase